MVRNYLLVMLAAFVLGLGLPVAAQESTEIATVNDQPITSFDIDQRIKLLEILGQKPPAGYDRHKIGNDLINDVVKIEEARRYHVDPTERDINDRLKTMAQNLKTDLPGLQAKFSAQGIEMGQMRQYISAQMSLGHLLNAKYHEKVEVTPAEVDAKFVEIKAQINGQVAKIMADPRRQSVTAYSIQTIDFPADAKDPQLLQSRAIEAGQYMQKFNGCKSAKAAASGIFNVRIGKVIEADGRKLPPPLKAAFDAKGVGHAIGPTRGKDGIQVLALCGIRSVTPPKLKIPDINRSQVENAALNEKYDKVEQRYVAVMRKTAIIEYKDQSYAQ